MVDIWCQYLTAASFSFRSCPPYLRVASGDACRLLHSEASADVGVVAAEASRQIAERSGVYFVYRLNVFAGLVVV